ncbi:PspA/IM30 family protein [Schlesneria sp.]|uniref:PspA/IM30 family protein n=1 Tax=Schlesneria sp. TaxID=2762018 RepID=UPI002F00F413
MSYFSRLTDIVTCNLSHLLAEAADPAAAIVEIIKEMEEGLTGAQRSVRTARASEETLRQEIDAHRVQVEMWTAKAREHLQSGAEADARQSLLRKREVEDLIAGLAQQHEAAIKYSEHLATMQRALEARLADALRRRDEMGVDRSDSETNVPRYLRVPTAPDVSDLHREIDDELEVLRKQISG